VATKSTRIATLLRRRIESGDYVGRDIPTEVALAQEVGISRPTLRKAVELLVEQGVIHRLSNGRLVRAQGNSTKLNLCLLSPAWAGAALASVRVRAEHVADSCNAVLRGVEFVHWDDACISEVLCGFDGVFLMPSTEPMSEALYDKLRNSRAKVVVLLGDLSPLGIPSIDLTPLESFNAIFAHLKEMGHRRLHCFNTQPYDVNIQRRVELWRSYLNSNSLDGELFNKPVKSYSDPMRQAYDLFSQLLRDQRLRRGDAVWCTTMAAAYGVNRAAHEAGVRVGIDLALAGADDDGNAWVNTPSITCIQPPDPGPYIKHVIDWIATGQPWQGDTLIQPQSLPLFVGESTTGLGGRMPGVKLSPQNTILSP
jgi:Periplasmic binding protein-like domain/Bacterial regulatory proteins, gntR family